MKDWNLPLAVDKNTKKVSVTLLFTFISGWGLVLSIIYMTFDEPKFAMFVWFAFFVTCMIFMRVRRIDDVEANLKTGSLKFSRDDDNKTENTNRHSYSEDNRDPEPLKGFNSEQK
jgi:hypothetical protein